MSCRHPVPGCFTLLLLTLSPFATGSTSLDDLVNYREYSPGLSSSGQPTEEQLAAVRDAGFERVVFLAFNDNDESLGNEDRVVKDLGMAYAHIPVDWEAPTRRDFYAFAKLLESDPDTRTLVHCQVNFRASTFSFLYRVLYLDVPIEEAKAALNTVWVPNATWRQLIFDVLEENGIAPNCATCLWE